MTLVRDAVTCAPTLADPAATAASVPAIVGVEDGGDGGDFRAVWTPVSLTGEGDLERAALPAATLEALGLRGGDGSVHPGATVTVAVRPRRRREDRL